MKIGYSSTSNMCTQSSIYFNKKIISNLFKHRISFVNTKANASSKSKTHYDTLNVSPDATHNEIKSSYFNLTVKYHPDKNKSQSAKVLFQEVSEAYEVLGNHKLRKQYDRSIAVRSSSVSQVQKPSPTHEHSSITRHKMYDFDEWNRAHYHASFESSLKRKGMHKEYIKIKERMEENEKMDFATVVGVIVIVTVILYLVIGNPHMSNDTVPKKKVD